MKSADKERSAGWFMLFGLDMHVVLMLAVGAAAGGFVNGLAGFGTSLFALGWWLQVLTPLEAVAISVAMSVLSGIPGFYTVRGAIDGRRLSRFLIPAILGIPFGLSILQWISQDVLKTVIGGFLILYGVYFFVRRGIPLVDRKLPVVDALLGFAGGVLGAVAGLSGALPTIWVSLKPWNKKEQRGVLQPFNIAVLGISAVGLWIQGAYTTLSWAHFAVVVPATLISAVVGIVIFGLLRDHQFRILLVVLSGLSGVILLAQTYL